MHRRRRIWNRREGVPHPALASSMGASNNSFESALIAAACWRTQSKILIVRGAAQSKIKQRGQNCAEYRRNCNRLENTTDLRPVDVLGETKVADQGIANCNAD